MVADAEHEVRVLPHFLFAPLVLLHSVSCQARLRTMPVPVRARPSQVSRHHKIAEVGKLTHRCRSRLFLFAHRRLQQWKATAPPLPLMKKTAASAVLTMASSSAWTTSTRPWAPRAGHPLLRFSSLVEEMVRPQRRLPHTLPLSISPLSSHLCIACLLQPVFHLPILFVAHYSVVLVGR
jgi:hypothetical protein